MFIIALILVIMAKVGKFYQKSTFCAKKKHVIAKLNSLKLIFYWDFKDMNSYTVGENLNLQLSNNNLMITSYVRENKFWDTGKDKSKD